MKQQVKTMLTDLEECRMKILDILKEYNCTIMDRDECLHVLLYDNDTNKTIGMSVQNRNFY